MTRTAVPEAGVDENDNLRSPEEHIRRTKYSNVLSVAKARVPKRETKHFFDAGVSLLYRRHHSAARCAVDRVYHL